MAGRGMVRAANAAGSAPRDATQRVLDWRSRTRICTNAAEMNDDGDEGASQHRPISNPIRLRKAGRAFLLRLVATHGPTEAARILRQLADELEWLRDQEAC